MTEDLYRAGVVQCSANTPALQALAPREHFPGTRTASYLNAAGIGLVPVPVQDAVCEYARALGSRGTRSYFDRYHELMVQPREAAARLLSAPLESVAIITSISEAISQIAWWRRPQRHENVVVVDIDCSSATYPWMRVAQETGAEVRFVRVARDPENLSLEAISRLVDPQTAAISLSHVQWITGLKLDLRALSTIAKSNGSLLVVDAMHSAGVLPFEGDELAHVDFLVTGAFKWICGYAGAGAIYVNPSVLADFSPILVGSRSSFPEPPFDEIDATRLQLPPDARRFEYGSSIVLPRIAFAEATKYLLNLGLDRIIEHNRLLSKRLMTGLEELGADILTPRDPNTSAAIVCARFGHIDPALLYARLQKRDVILSLRAGTLRFSPHFFNNSDDVDFALDELRAAL